MHGTRLADGVVDSAARIATFQSPGGSVNHLMHALLSVLTCGLWIIVWVLDAIFTITGSGPKTMTLTVSESGEVQYTETRARRR